MKIIYPLIMMICLCTSIICAQEPCLPDCCPDGPQHTYEGLTGPLPPSGSSSSGGWEASQGSPTYVADGCDSPQTSVSLSGTSFNPGDQATFSTSGVSGQDIIFEEGLTYCIQLCMKNLDDTPGQLTLLANVTPIGTTPTFTNTDGWQTVEITFTAFSFFTEFSVLNNSTTPNDNPPTILFDDVCITEINPDALESCQADFSYEIMDCGEVCFIDESCGEITSSSWIFTGPGLPSGGISSSDNNPCVVFTVSGTYIAQLTVNCSDGISYTETKTINYVAPDPPTINCPMDSLIVVIIPNGEPCEGSYTVPVITVSNGSLLFCELDGINVFAGQMVTLSPGVHTMTCVGLGSCDQFVDCEYTITVECDEESINCEGPCYDFNDPNSSINWQRANHQGNAPTQFSPVNLASRGPGDTYLDGIDVSGSTRLINEVDYVGDWSAFGEECCFCFDFKYIDDANTSTSARPQLTIYQGPERNPTLSARFVSNYILTDNDPWQNVCASISPCNSGQLPSNSDGYWLMVTGSGCSDWNTLLSNIDGISFPLDYNTNPNEKHGYDNTCWKACPANPCDSFMVMVDTIARPGNCIDPSIITGNSCITQYDPVCGCDGNTYGNACEAREQGVTIISSGECNGNNTPEPEGCCYSLDIVLKSVSVSAIGVKRLNAGVSFNTVMINDPAFSFTTNPTSTELVISPTTGSTFGPGVFNDLVKFCLSLDSIAPPTQSIEITYYNQNGDELDVLCRKSIEVGCDPPPGEDPCVQTSTGIPTCNDDTYDLDITVQNLSTSPPFIAHQVVFTSCDPTIDFRPDGTNLPGNGSIGIPLIPSMGPSDPAQTLPVDIVPLSPITAPTLFCFETTIWNNNMCCTAPAKTCVTLVPCCNPCDSSFYTEVPYEITDTSILSIKPGPTMDDAYLSGCQVGGSWTNSTNLFTGNAWGGASDGCSSDAYLNFPLSEICDDAIILHAELKLFADPLSFGHINTTSLTSSCLDIKRVTSNWSESSTSLIPPSSTSTNQIGLPLPTTPFQDFAVDVTALVQDMLANPTNSFGFVLDASCPLDLQYIFASGEHSNSALWPELVVTYDRSACAPLDTACCHALDIDVDCADDFFTKLDLELITPGVIIGSHFTGSSVPLDWSNPISTSQRVIWEHFSGRIPEGNYNQLINFCLGDIDPGESPQELTLKWITEDQNGMDSIACIDTLRYMCEPPINDSCLAVIDIVPKSNLCDTCYVEPFCNSWLLDEVIDLASNICPGTANVETGTWLGDPVFIITTDLGTPHTFVERIYTCQGIEIQNCHDYIGGFSCDPNAGIDVTTDIIGRNLIWSCGDPIPITPLSCTVSSIPNSIDYCLTIKNVTNPAHLATQLLIQSLDPSVIVWPSPITFPGSGLPSGGIATVDINISGNINPGDMVKVAVRLHDHLSGDDWCCFESDTLCIEIPLCPPDDCCNASEEEFNDLLDLVSTPIIDIENCQACWDLSVLDSCDNVEWSIDNMPVVSLENELICQSWTDNLPHTICMTLNRWSGGDIGNGEPCMTQDTCFEVNIPCTSCDDLDCDDLHILARPSAPSLDSCCYYISVDNNYCADYFKGLKISLSGNASISSVLTKPGWIINQLDSYNAEVYPIGGGYIPLGMHTPFSICNTSSTNYVVTVNWLHRLPDDTCIELCPSDIELSSCENEFSCYEYVQDSIDCQMNQFCFKIKNTSIPGFDLYVAHLYNTTGGIVFTPNDVNIPNAPLSSGQTSDWICVTYSGVNPGDQPCFKIAASDQPAGTPPMQCCTDTLVTCITIPECPDCCDDFDEFCDLIDLGFSLSRDSCSVTINAPQFDTCHWFGTSEPDWGDGSIGLPILTPAVSSGLWTHTYAQNGTYNICITVFEGTDEDNLCWDKQLCTEVVINCECGELNCDDLDITISPDPTFGDSCCFIGTIDNNYCADYFKGIKISSNASTISQLSSLHGWYINQISPYEAELYPRTSVGLGSLDIFRVCNENFSGPFSITATWLIDDGNGGCDEVCLVKEVLDCSIRLPNNCIQLLTDTVRCDIKQYCFTIENTTSPGFDIKSIVLHNISPSGSLLPTVISINPSLTFGQSKEICVSYQNVIAGDSVCYTMTGHNVDLNDDPFPTICCADTLVHCFVVPECCGELNCDDLDITISPDPTFGDSCCFIGTIDNNYCADYFKGIKISSNASTISQLSSLHGWYINQISPYEAELYPRTSVGLGSLDIFRVCNENFSGPFSITATWLIDDGNGGCDEVCPEFMDLTCGTPPPPNSCINIISDRTICETEEYCFTIVNNTRPAYAIKSVVIHNTTPAGSLSPLVISIPTLAPGASTEICVDYNGVPVGEDICYTITGHNVDLNDDPFPTICCADTIVHCFTVPNCADCCTDYDTFCDLIELGYDVRVDSSELTVTLDQFDSCHWYINDGPDWGDSTGLHPGPINAAGSHSWSHTYDSTGMYNICIDVYEGDDMDNICWQKQICKMLWIVCDHPTIDSTDINPCGPSKLSIPTGFTPNADGFNDALIISGPSECTPIDIKVFNRWGQIVYEQKDYDNTWEGISLNGERLVDGTYYLVADFHSVVNQRIDYQQYTKFIDIRTQ